MFDSQSASPSGGVKGVNPVPEKRSDLMQIDQDSTNEYSENRCTSGDPNEPQDDFPGKEGENAVEPSIGCLIPSQNDRCIDAESDHE